MSSLISILTFRGGSSSFCRSVHRLYSIAALSGNSILFQSVAKKLYILWYGIMEIIVHSEGLKHTKSVPSHTEGALSAETDGPGVK